MPVEANMVDSLPDHLSPARRRRVDPDAQEAEGGFREDRLRDPQRDRDDHGREQVREDVAEHDADPARPPRPRGLRVLPLPPAPAFGADPPADRKPRLGPPGP